jgi:hypothetical protein
VSKTDRRGREMSLLQPPGNATIICSALVLLCVLDVIPGADRAFVLAQDLDVVEDVEAYAVYKAVLPIKFSSGDRELTHITLLQETRAGSMECPRDENIQPEWRSVVENYRSVNARVRRIQAGRDLGVPYTLLTWAELTKMMRDAGYDLSKFSGRQSPGAEVFSRLKGARLVALSAVGFDPAKTRAMVTVQYNCFPSMQPGVNTQLCHQGNQVMLEKQADRWVPSKVGGCGWIA